MKKRTWEEKVRSLVWGAIFSALLTTVLTSPSHAAQNRALLIGVADYSTQQRLRNPVEDARLLDAALRKLGWSTTLVTDPDSVAMKAAIAAFARGSTSETTVNLIYFSGHGMQLRGENYLLPRDARQSLDDVLRRSMTVGEILRSISGGSRASIVIVDACRDNPLGPQSLAISTGLNSQAAPPNSLIAFATSPGSTALDGTGGNSPYSISLVQALETAKTTEDLFRLTRIGTMRITNGSQVPWETSSLLAAVSIQILPSSVPTAPQGPAPALTAPRPPPTAALTVPPVRLEPGVNLPAPAEGPQHAAAWRAAVEYLRAKVQEAPLSGFGNWQQRPPTERDRSDYLQSLDLLQLGQYPRGNGHELGSALLTGVIRPRCSKGAGIDPQCGDSDRWLRFAPDFGLGVALAIYLYNERISANELAEVYAHGWGLERDMLFAYDLFIEDRRFGGEYYWTEINRMAQLALQSFGEQIAVDGDFGPLSCAALRRRVPGRACGTTISRDDFAALLEVARRTTAN